MRLFLEILLVDVLLVGFYLVMRSTFDECLTDDVAFRYGKAKAQRRKKREPSFWRRFFFLDIRHMVVPWHYVLFWVNFAAAVLLLVALDIRMVVQTAAAEYLSLAVLAVYLLSLIPASLVRWRLYRGNRVRNREEWRRRYEK